MDRLAKLLDPFGFERYKQKIREIKHTRVSMCMQMSKLCTEELLIYMQISKLCCTNLMQLKCEVINSSFLCCDQGEMVSI